MTRLEYAIHVGGLSFAVIVTVLFIMLCVVMLFHGSKLNQKDSE